VRRRRPGNDESRRPNDDKKNWNEKLLHYFRSTRSRSWPYIAMRAVGASTVSAFDADRVPVFAALLRPW
jgi:hypothetical protein